MGERIGFIGLGNMGAPMLRRLRAAQFDVVAWDKSTDALGRAVAAGARAAPSGAACAAEADVLLTSLPRPDHVAAVMRDEGVLSALPEGALWIDLTTNRPELLRDLAVTRSSVQVVDAPVTGAVDGARQGRLTLFAGGEADALDRAEPILGTLGRVVRCGPLGLGNVVKLATNQLWFVHAAALGEAFALGVSQGVELDVLWEAIKESVGDSFVARHDAPSIFAGHYDPSFSLDLCLKDLGLIREMTDRLAAELPLTAAAHRAFDRAGSRYGATAGELHVARQIEEDSDLSFRLEGDWTPPWEA